MKLQRGEIWTITLDPIIGHEQGGLRPALILSIDAFNAAGGEDVFVVPITSKYRDLRTRVHIVPPEGGLSVDSYILCDKIRSLSKRRLKKRLGRASDDTVSQVEAIVSKILGL
jgi:mRNA interferase MazF